MKIQLTLYKSLILESIKGETYIKGIIDRSTSDDATALSYHETAGNEEVHERKLLRCMYVALAKVKTEIATFLDLDHSTQGNNIYSEENEDGERIYLFCTVSDRFNKAMADPLAKLISNFIENYSLNLWFGTFNQQQAQFYQALVNENLKEIKNSFMKKAPVSVATPYSQTLSITGDEITIEVGDEETVTYTIDEGACDDIELISDSRCIKVVHDFGQFVITGVYPGVAHCILYSVHDETNVYAELDVIVEGEPMMPPPHHPRW